MKYAIFSDIHGNFPALSAALDDAALNSANAYLFVGDYYRDFPWPNEVAEAIRGLPSVTAIRGNGEDYLLKMNSQDPSGWTYKQMELNYWNYRALTKENRAYITSFPARAQIHSAGGPFYMAHISDITLRTPRIPLFDSSSFRAEMEKAPFTHAEYLSKAREALLARPDVIADLRARPRGVYLCGHNHLQFHMEFEGRILINPGSCGEALDFDNRAAYTLLEYADGAWEIDERRVAYDVEKTAEALRESALAACAPEFARVIERQLLSGRENFWPFLMHLNETAHKNGQPHSPVSNEVWALAVSTYDFTG